MGEPFYITTAISYPNGPPHIAADRRSEMSTK